MFLHYYNVCVFVQIQRDEQVEKEGEWQGKLERWASSLEEAIRVITREQLLRKKMSAIEKDRLQLRNQLNSLLTDREQWRQKVQSTSGFHCMSVA